MIMLDSRGGGAGGASYSQASGGQSNNSFSGGAQPAPQNDLPTIEAEPANNADDEINVEDIPF